MAAQIKLVYLVPFSRFTSLLIAKYNGFICIKPKPANFTSSNGVTPLPTRASIMAGLTRAHMHGAARGFQS